jgi:hypothetical protein
MASTSLYQSIKKNKQQSVSRLAGGQLVQEPSLQEKAETAGLPSTPLTPAGGSMIGATPDQTKMIGTPAQKQQALATSSEGTLAESMRRAQTRSQATGAEQAQIEKGEKASQLSDLQSRAQSLVQQTFSTQGLGTTNMVTAGQALVTTDPAFASALGITSTTTDEQRRVILDNAAASLADPVKLATLANGAGMTPANFEAKLRATIASEDAQRAAAASAAAKSVADTATVADLRKQGLGSDMTDDQLAGLLGVSTADMAKMTITDFQNKIAELEQSEFTRTQQATQELGSGLLGGAEAEAARGQLREMSAVGTRAAEAQMSRVADAIDQGDTVTFGGQEISIRDLLSDTTITKYVQDYLANPESEFSKALRAQNPDFVKFIDSNKAIFAKVATDLETGITGINKAQAEKQKIADDLGLTQEALTSIWPEYGKLAGDISAIPPGVTQISNMLRTMNPEQKRAAQSQLQTLSPDNLKQFMGLSQDQMSRLDLGNPQGNMAKWAAGATRRAEIQKAKQSGDPDAIIAAIYGTDAQTIKDRITQERMRARLGLPNNLAQYDIIVNDYGMLESNLGPAIDKAMGESAPSIMDAANGNTGKFYQSDANLSQISDEDMKFAKALEDADIDHNGQVNFQEVVAALPDKESLETFLNKYHPSSLPQADRQALQDTVKHWNKQKKINTELSSMKQNGNWEDNVNPLTGNAIPGLLSYLRSLRASGDIDNATYQQYMDDYQSWKNEQNTSKSKREDDLSSTLLQAATDEFFPTESLEAGKWKKDRPHIRETKKMLKGVQSPFSR